MISDWELREIYRKNAVKRGIPHESAEDVAQEMFALALANEKARGISRFNQSAHWLYFTARANVFFRSYNRKKSGWVKLAFGDHPQYGTLDDGYPLYSQERYEEWLCSIWAATSNRDGARFIKRYKCSVDGIEIEFSAQELKELLGKQHQNVTDGTFASNLKKRGKRMFLIDGMLFRELKDACLHFGYQWNYFSKLHKCHDVKEVKLWVK